MGTAMVARLLLTHHQVTVFNRTPEKMDPLIALGAIKADSIAKAVSVADIVMSSLLDDEAVLEVAKKMIPHMKSGTIHIGLATILPDTAKTLLALHQQVHTYYLSAPVLGISSVAREGLLTCFCAGHQQALDIGIPLLSIFVKTVIPLGDESKITSPNLMKICMNYSLMATLELISELYVFAEKGGLDKEVLKIGLHQIYSHPAFKRYIDKISDRDFDHVNFNMAGGAKDINLFETAFSQVGVEPKIGHILKSRFQEALSAGMKDKDWSAIYEVVRKNAGLL